MVPTTITLLDALPLSSNGKVDRQRLPEPSRYSAELAAEYLAPRTTLEQTIAQVWQEVLGLEQVGMHDNFFELGGHSLLIPEVQVKLHTALQRTISVIDLFQHPTISALREYLGHESEQKPSLQQSYDRAEKRKHLQRQAPHSKLKR